MFATHVNANALVHISHNYWFNIPHFAELSLSSTQVHHQFEIQMCPRLSSPLFQKGHQRIPSGRCEDALVKHGPSPAADTPPLCRGCSRGSLTKQWGFQAAAILAGNSGLNTGVPHDIIHGCAPFRRSQCSAAPMCDGSLSHTATGQDTIFLNIIGIKHLPAISCQYFRPAFLNWWVRASLAVSLLVFLFIYFLF